LPPVKIPGSGCMPPGCTLLLAVKLRFRIIDAKPGDPAEKSRSSNATSEGEFTLVGTFGVENVGDPLVRVTSESLGKTRYISTTTLVISVVGASNGIRPVKAAPVISVCCVSTKSSPVSISELVPGRVAVAIRPSGLPVLKKNESAAAGNGITAATNASAAIPVRAFKRMSVMNLPPSPVWKIVAVNDS
jgi:hypothetical protein